MCHRLRPESVSDIYYLAVTDDMKMMFPFYSSKDSRGKMCFSHGRDRWLVLYNTQNGPRSDEQKLCLILLLIVLTV